MLLYQIFLCHIQCSVSSHSHRSSIPTKSLIYGPFTMCCRLFTLSQGEKPILDRSARCAISALFSIMEHKHHTKMCANTLSILISIHFTSKFEESQRNLRFYSRHNNPARWSLTQWIDVHCRSTVIFLRAKIPNGIFHYELRLLKMILPKLLCRE